MIAILVCWCHEREKDERLLCLMCARTFNKCICVASTMTTAILVLPHCYVAALLRPQSSYILDYSRPL